MGSVAVIANGAEGPIRHPGERAALYITLALAGGITIAANVVVPALILLGVAVLYVLVQVRQHRGNAVKVVQGQIPRVHQLAVAAAQRLKMRVPEVFITQDPTLNAFASGVSHKWVVLNSALVSGLDDKELLFVIGHEFTHCRERHTLWYLLAGQGGTPVKLPVLTAVFALVLRFWSRKAEFTADRGGLVACGDLASAATALIKIAVGPDLARQVDVSKFLDQDRDSADLRGVEFFSTHPFLTKRVEALVAFSQKIGAA